MDIEVDDEHAFDLPAVQKCKSGDGEVVEEAEPGAAIGTSMMSATPRAAGQAELQSRACREEGTTWRKDFLIEKVFFFLFFNRYSLPHKSKDSQVLQSLQACQYATYSSFPTVDHKPNPRGSQTQS